MRTLRDLTKWGAASAVTLLVVEITLKSLGQPFYTELYRRVRRSPAIVVRIIPLLVAGVVLMHLEEKLPRRWDPFARLADLLTR